MRQLFRWPSTGSKWLSFPESCDLISTPASICGRETPSFPLLHGSAALVAVTGFRGPSRRPINDRPSIRPATAPTSHRGGSPAAPVSLHSRSTEIESGRDYLVSRLSRTQSPSGAASPRLRVPLPSGLPAEMNTCVGRTYRALCSGGVRHLPAGFRSQGGGAGRW